MGRLGLREAGEVLDERVCVCVCVCVCVYLKDRCYFRLPHIGIEQKSMKLGATACPSVDGLFN